MAWKTQTTKRRTRHRVLWTVAVLAVAAYFGWPKVKGRYHRWDAKRKVAQAGQALAEKDYKRAVIGARAALSADPGDVNATRVIARALEAVGSAEAVQWWSRLDSLEPGNPENLLAWAAVAMKAGDIAAAERVLNMLKRESRENVTYHTLLAQISVAKRDTEAAKTHWAEVGRLDPKEGRHRLSLAILGLRSQDPKERDEAVATLTELSEATPPSIDAVRVLLERALRLEDWKMADTLSKTLVVDSTATFGDKLQRLTALRKMNTQDAPGYLVELREAALSKPGELYTLFMWMNENQLAMMVSEWTRTMPQDVLAAPPVSVGVADAYARGSEWGRLQEFLNLGDWADWDYLRRAFLARALERLDDAERAKQEWKDAVAAARGRPDARQCLDRLARVASNWGWKQRAEEVMWTLTATPGCPRWVLETLWATSMERADVAQLQKLAGIRAQADSKSAELRNEYAFYSLLAHSKDGDPHGEAEKLFNENPGNAGVAITRALSHYQQGKVADAVALSGSLPAAELKKPKAALYHAIFLTAAGESAKAAEFLAVAQERRMFPEEKTLLERARQSLAQAAEKKSIAEAGKAVRAAKSARDAEVEKAVEAARAERAAQAAKAAAEAAEALGAARAARAARAGRAAAEAAAAPPPVR